MPAKSARVKAPVQRMPVKRSRKPRKTVPSAPVGSAPAIELARTEVPPASSTPKPTKPIILNGVSGEKIVIGIHPDGSSVIGREGRGHTAEESSRRDHMILTGRSGRKIALAIKPDGTPVVGFGRFPSKGEPEVPPASRPAAVKVVLEGPMGPDVPNQNPYGDSVRPEDVNPSVKRIDPKLFRPMSMRVVEETPQPALSHSPAEPPSPQPRESVRKTRRNHPE